MVDERAIATLRDNEAELRRHGVRRVAQLELPRPVRFNHRPDRRVSLAPGPGTRYIVAMHKGASVTIEAPLPVLGETELTLMLDEAEADEAAGRFVDGDALVRDLRRRADELEAALRQA